MVGGTATEVTHEMNIIKKDRHGVQGVTPFIQGHPLLMQFPKWELNPIPLHKGLWYVSLAVTKLCFIDPSGHILIIYVFICLFGAWAL